MELSENPSGYSIAYLLIVVFSLAFLVGYHPQKKTSLIEKYRRAERLRASKTQDKQRAYQTYASNTDSTQNSSDSAKNEEKEEEIFSIKEESNSVYFTKLVDEYKKTTLSKIKKPDSRTDLVIRYYKKKLDENKVYNLRDYGFYLHERPSEILYSKFGSNAIYYGDSVSPGDIQLIAYVLINSGLQIKQIALSKFHDTWKAHSVEIGTDTTVLKAPNIDLATIRKNWAMNESN